MTASLTESSVALHRQGRVLVLLNGLTEAGLSPTNILVFHAYAYLCNVIAPVWDLSPHEGKVLKRRGGPFYPELQNDLDRLVGLGMVKISGVTHVKDEAGAWRLEGSYDLNESLSRRAVEFLTSLPHEGSFARFAREVAFAMSALGDNDLADAMEEDATYSDPEISFSNVLDFGEWNNKNLTTNAAHYFDVLMRGRTRITPGEKLHMYVRHLGRRLHAG